MLDPQFETYCDRWSADVAQLTDDAQRMSYFQKHLPELLLDRDTVALVLTQMKQGRTWPDLKKAGLFSHEVLLYLDPSRRFSIRLYFHPPHTHTDIHDHSSWGVSGTPFGRLSVIGYDCEGDLAGGQVQLQRKEQKILQPGEVDLTRAWKNGIHQTGSVDDEINVMISAYGSPGRRLYVNLFDAETGAVEKVYPPRMMLRRLAGEALDVMKG